MKKKKNEMKNKVMAKIKSHDVKMKPKAYFVLVSLLLGVGLALSVLLAMLFVNIVFFRLRVYAPFGYLSLGSAGLRAFIFNFPLIHLAVVSIGFVVGLKLLKKYDISYKKNFKYIAIFVISAILTFGFVLDKLNVGDKLIRNKGIKPLFMHDATHAPWVAGEVVEVDEEVVIIQTHLGKEIQLQLNEVINAPLGREFGIGDKIRAVGEWRGDVFVVKGIVKGKGNPNLPSGEVRGLKNFRQGKPLQ